MGSPYVLYVSAWLFLLGRSGPINDMSRSFFGVNMINVYSLPGMMFVEGFLWSPLVFLMMTAVFRNGNAEMEEAARVSGASIFFTVWHISIRMARPAVLALAIFTFVRNVEAFEVPALIGMPGRIEVLTTQIYDTIKQVPPNLGQASAFSVLLLLIVAVVLLYYGRISAKAEQYAGTFATGKGYRPRQLDLKNMRAVGGAIIVINFVILLGLPLLAIVWTALMPFNLPMRWSNMHFATWQNFTTVLHSKHNLEMAVNTLIVAASAATAVMIISMLAGWIAARRKPAGRIIDQLTAVPLMFPGIVLGVAILQTALHLPGAIYGTVTLIAIGYTIRYMPYGMRYCYAGVLQIHKDLEDVAGVSGASLGRKLCRIVAPLLAPSLVAGWLFIFWLPRKSFPWRSCWPVRIRR